MVKHYKEEHSHLQHLVVLSQPNASIDNTNINMTHTKLGSNVNVWTAFLQCHQIPNLINMRQLHCHHQLFPSSQSTVYFNYSIILIVNQISLYFFNVFHPLHCGAHGIAWRAMTCTANFACSVRNLDKTHSCKRYN